MYLDNANHFIPFGTLTAPVVSGTGVLAFRFLCMRQCKVRRVGIAISTAISSSGTVVIAVTKRPTIGSSSAEVAIATITVPAAQAVATSVYKDAAAPVQVAPGQEVAFNVTTAATSAGAGIPMIMEVDDDPDTAANISVLTLSA